MPHKYMSTFRSKMVIFPARNANIYKICELHRAIFSSFYKISQPNLICSFTHFKMLFLGVVLDFILLVLIKISSIVESLIAEGFKFSVRVRGHINNDCKTFLCLKVEIASNSLLILC